MSICEKHQEVEPCDKCELLKADGLVVVGGRAECPNCETMKEAVFISEHGMCSVCYECTYQQDAPLTETALSTQVGGGHYKSLAIQPVEYNTRNKLGFIEGCVVKYVTRHGSKNGRQDIEKAIHFLNLLLELEYAEAKQ